MAKRPTPPRKRPTRGFSRYKRSETARLVKGAMDAGLTVRGLEIDPRSGVMRVLVGQPGAEAERDTPERILKNL
jgi:hypothetical protein